MKTFRFVLLALSLFGSTLWSQVTADSSPPPFPPGPLIQKRAPSNAQWLITTTVSGTDALNDTKQNADAAAKAAQAPSTTKIMVTKTGSIYRVERLDLERQLWTVWAQGATQIMVWPDKQSAAELAVSNNPDAPNPFMTDFSNTDFPGFGWVKLPNYVGIKDYKGIKCIVYQEQQNQKSDDPAASKLLITVTAYVDVDSRLPIVLVRGDELSAFDWKAAPQGTLKLPPSAEAILEQRQKAAKQMSQQAARPF